MLTLFERLTSGQLPFYLHLMKHLAQRGIPVPEPQALPGSATADNPDGELLHQVCGKPAAVVDRLHGTSELAPTTAHCAAVGEMLARMHLAGRDYPRHQPNLRGLAWWNETVPVVLPYVDEAQAALLASELAFQNHVAAGSAYRRPAARPHPCRPVPRQRAVRAGPADRLLRFLFRRRRQLAVRHRRLPERLVRRSGQRGPRRRARGGVPGGLLPACGRSAAAERQLLPAMLRAGALRFWISRLWDFHLPREAAHAQGA